MSPDSALQAAMVFGLSPAAIALSLGLRSWGAQLASPWCRAARVAGLALIGLFAATWLTSTAMVVFVLMGGLGS